MRLSANTSLAPQSGIGLYLSEGSATAATDKAKPVPIASTWTDGDVNDVDAGDTITLTFSEAVTTRSMVVEILWLPVSGDSLATTTIANQASSTTTPLRVGTRRALLTPCSRNGSGARLTT